MALWALEVLQIALLLSLFVTSHFLNSPFSRIGALEHHNIRTNASPAGSFGHWANSPFCPSYSRAYGNRALPDTSSTVTLTSKGTLERLGSDEYRNVVDPFSSFVGIEETDSLERSYVDILRVLSQLP